MFEMLESRRMLSGNVSAAIVGGTLVVNGDNKSNGVDIATHGDFTTTVTPLPGTTVNGSAATAVFGGFPDVRADMGNGDDTVIMRDFTGNSAAITTGNGNDSVIATWGGYPDNEPNNLSIDTGNGDDFVRFENGTFASSDVNVSTGNGDDTMQVSGYLFSLGNITFNGGRGHDSLDTTGGLVLAFGTVKFIDIETVI